MSGGDVTNQCDHIECCGRTACLRAVPGVPTARPEPFTLDEAADWVEQHQFSGLLEAAQGLVDLVDARDRASALRHAESVLAIRCPECVAGPGQTCQIQYEGPSPEDFVHVSRIRSLTVPGGAEPGTKEGSRG